MTKQRLGQIRCPRRRLHIYDGSLGGEPVHVFLQAQVKLRHLPGGFPAHIAVVPGLIDNACDLAFGVGIAQDKTVFPAVLDQPLLDQGVLLPLVQNLINDQKVEIHAGMLSTDGHPIIINVSRKEM